MVKKTFDILFTLKDMFLMTSLASSLVDCASVLAPSSVTSSGSASSAAVSPHSLHLKDLDLLASTRRSSAEKLRDPMVPCPGLGMKPMMARRAVRMDQLGCHVSGWCPDMDRQILVFTSKRPLGCKRKRIE